MSKINMPDMPEGYSMEVRQDFVDTEYGRVQQPGRSRVSVFHHYERGVWIFRETVKIEVDHQSFPSSAGLEVVQEQIDRLHDKLVKRLEVEKLHTS